MQAAARQGGAAWFVTVAVPVAQAALAAARAPRRRAGVALTWRKPWRERVG